MKIDKVGAAFVAGGVLLAVVTVGLVIYRLDLSMLYTVLLILVGGVVVALVVAASAFPIRAARERIGPHERERVIMREKHTIDGRVAEAPKIHLLQQGQPGMAGMYPELLRASYLAGRRSLGDGDGQPQIVEGEVTDLTAEWNGEISD